MIVLAVVRASVVALSCVVYAIEIVITCIVAYAVVPPRNGLGRAPGGGYLAKTSGGPLRTLGCALDSPRGALVEPQGSLRRALGVS